MYSNQRIQFAVMRNSLGRISNEVSSTDIREIFSAERVTAVFKKAGLVPGEAMDIKAGYDFDLLADRKRCWELILRDEPLLNIGSPPCTMFSHLQELHKHIC